MKFIYDARGCIVHIDVLPLVGVSFQLLISLATVRVMTCTLTDGQW